MVLGSLDPNKLAIQGADEDKYDLESGMNRQVILS